MVRTPSSIAEGTGTVREKLASWWDASIWIQDDLDDPKRVLIARDGDSAEECEYIKDWLTQECSCFFETNPGHELP
jgi:hypothetical protein